MAVYNDLAAIAAREAVTTVIKPVTVHHSGPRHMAVTNHIKVRLKLKKWEVDFGWASRSLPQFC